MSTLKGHQLGCLVLLTLTVKPLSHHNRHGLKHSTKIMFTSPVLLNALKASKRRHTLPVLNTTPPGGYISTVRKSCIYPHLLWLRVVRLNTHYFPVFVRRNRMNAGQHMKPLLTAKGASPETLAVPLWQKDKNIQEGLYCC